MALECFEKTMIQNARDKTHPRIEIEVPSQYLQFSKNSIGMQNVTSLHGKGIYLQFYLTRTKPTPVYFNTIKLEYEMTKENQEWAVNKLENLIPVNFLRGLQ